MQTYEIKQKDNIFLYLSLLTGFFLLLETNYFLQCNRAYFYDYTFASNSLHIPTTIIPGILFFLFAQISIHLFYCLLIWGIVRSITGLIPVSSRNIIFIAIGTWVLGIATILTANQYYFPNSKFSELTSMLLVNQEIAKAVLILLSLSCGIVSCVALIGFIRILLHKIFFIFPLVLALAVSSGFTFLKPDITKTLDAASASRPNIILIGVDSLRPDFLSYFGYDKETPFFDSFLHQATAFSEAITPLARTFPSWSSILTGQYPLQNHIRSNLASQENLNLTNTLPAILQRNGYETIYATDETRFSNIDKNFGFDKVITPPMGLNDFIIGNFNDFPLSNLLVNTTIGKWLFPHSYANRPVYFLYEPDSFLNLVKPELNTPRNKPLFLAIHFCLPHSPYLWSDFTGVNKRPQEHYAASIIRVDQQIRDFFNLLKQSQVLDHAIVVLLSDHGEALELNGDRLTENDSYISSKPGAVAPKFYPPSLDKEEINQSAGHGTDVLGLSQYHSLLAFKLYGAGEYKPGMVTGVVTLLDIKPTILDLLHIPAPDSSGISLANAVTNQLQEPVQSRHLFLESDFSPEAIRTVYPEIRKVLLEGIDMFQVNPSTTRLTVKSEMESKIIDSKQYADIYGVWMLALYPQNKDERMPILINLNNGEWTNDLQTPFALNSPAMLMLKALKAFYGNEISSISTAVDTSV